MSPQPSAIRIALALLGAARGEPLTIPMLIGAGEVLQLSPNAMRVALSRLTSRGEVTARRRGAYALSSAQRLEVFAHVRRYRTGFAPAWPGKVTSSGRSPPISHGATPPSSGVGCGRSTWPASGR